MTAKQKNLFCWVIVFLLFYSQNVSSKATHYEYLKPKPSPKYKAHVHTAKGFGIPALKTNKQIKSYVKNKKLRSVSTRSKGYFIYKLTYSKPYLVPKANTVLKDIARQFYAKTKSSFAVTSVTRSLEDQKRLFRVNKNAKKDLSSHNYGCSFDISYIRFNNKLGTNSRLEKALTAVLNQFQKQGKIYFIKEHQQKCYHITVRS